MGQGVGPRTGDMGLIRHNAAHMELWSVQDYVSYIPAHCRFPRLDGVG